MPWIAPTMAAPNFFTLGPPILNSHLPAELYPTFLLNPQTAGDSSPAILHTQSAECGNFSTCISYAGPILQSTQQPDAAQVSTDLTPETWATEQVNDTDRKFLLSGVRDGFHLLPINVTITDTCFYKEQSICSKIWR